MPSSWFFQRSRRQRGWYVQAVERVYGKASRTLGLG